MAETFAKFNPPKFGEYAKIPYDYLIMEQIGNLGRQTLRLPHEAIMEGYNKPVGSTYKDIITSYCDGVEHLEAMLEPYLTDIYRKDELPKKRPEKDIRQVYDYAKKKFTGLIQVCEERSYLLKKIVTNADAEDTDEIKADAVAPLPDDSPIV